MVEEEILTLKKADMEVERLENLERLIIAEKERLFNTTQPKSPNTSDIRVQGGKRSDRYLNYVISDEEKELDKKMDKAFKKKQNYLNWIDKELKILNKYSEFEQAIVFLKERSTEKMTWRQISKKIGYSISQCKKIYKQYKQKRSIDN